MSNSQASKRSDDRAGEDERPSPYPTYRTGPVPPHLATTTKPTDVGLRRDKRTYSWPALVAVGLAAIVGVALIAWGLGVVMTQDAPPLTPELSDTEGIASPEAEGEGVTPAPEIGPEPAPIDLPGGN